MNSCLPDTFTINISLQAQLQFDAGPVTLRQTEDSDGGEIQRLTEDGSVRATLPDCP